MLDLLKSTEYSIRVEALSVNGSGPSSTWITAVSATHDLDGECRGNMTLIESRRNMTKSDGKKGSVGETVLVVALYES